jgi:tRNA-dihydrouridine synthase
MIGRAAIGYPWIFREIKHFFETGQHLNPPSVEERVAVCRKHLRRSIEWKNPVVGINEMRRHYANYLKGLPNIKEFRNQLVTLKTEEEINAVLDQVAKTYAGYQFEKTSIELINYHQHCPIN